MKTFLNIRSFRAPNTDTFSARNTAFFGLTTGVMGPAADVAERGRETTGLRNTARWQLEPKSKKHPS